MLEKGILPLFETNYIDRNVYHFQENGAPCHTSKVATVCIRKCAVTYYISFHSRVSFIFFINSKINHGNDRSFLRFTISRISRHFSQILNFTNSQKIMQFSSYIFLSLSLTLTLSLSLFIFLGHKYSEKLTK